MKLNKKIVFKTLLVFILLVPVFLQAQEFLEMPKPTHTVKGVPTSTLEKVKEIKLDHEDDLFFAFLWEIKVNKTTGWIYAYDAKLFRLFIFDEKYRYVGQFLEKGVGPGEVNSSSSLTIMYYPARNGNVYVTDGILDRFLQFSKTGKFIDGKRMNRRSHIISSFSPVSDKNGYIYAYSLNNGIVDMLDSDMNCVHTFLDIKLNEKFVIYKPYIQKFEESSPGAIFWRLPRMSNTTYAITSNDRLLIYLFRSSTAYIFKGKKLERKFEVFVDYVLPRFRKSAEDTHQKYKNSETFERKEVRRAHMFNSCFVDQDEPYFYLNFVEECEHLIFKFDLNGKLVRIIKSDMAQVFTKANGLFYGLSFYERNPIILKEKEEKK